jgi:hypothetical protein
MKAKSTFLWVLLAGATLARPALAQLSTLPPDAAEKEKLYSEAIEKRTERVLKSLEGIETAKATQVHDLVVNQYRVLRSRDAAIDVLLGLMGKSTNLANREPFLITECKPLHDQFVSKLSAVLTPEQIEKVKNQMTYNKVKVTYDTYSAVVPDLSESERARIMEELKLAREDALDAGSSAEKFEIFQKYKDRINEFLSTNGRDVKTALKEWEARQEAEKKSSEKTADKAK